MLVGLTFLLDCLVFLTYSSWAGSAEGQERLLQVFSQDLAESISGVLLILALIYLAIGISTLMLSRGLYRGYEVARRKGRRIAVLSIIFATLGAVILGAILPERLDIHVSWWSIFFNAGVVIYLGRPKVRAYFVSSAR